MGSKKYMILWRIVVIHKILKTFVKCKLFPLLQNPTQEKTRKRKEKEKDHNRRLLQKRVPDTPPTPPPVLKSRSRSPMELGTRYLRAKYRCGFRFGRIDGGSENRFENTKDSFWFEN
jgi:hypothetical protein